MIELKTELNDRILWYDGVSEVSAVAVPKLILEGVPIDALVVRNPDQDIIKFNQLEDQQIANDKVDLGKICWDWQIPMSYLEMDIKDHLRGLLLSRSLTDPRYSERLEQELKLITGDTEQLFKALIFVIDRFKEQSQVWGVGRGSSCASLALFLIGLHLVDPVKYDIPSSEFFH